MRFAICCVMVLAMVGGLLRTAVGEVPVCVSPELKFESWVEGIKEPTSMAWVTLPRAGGGIDDALLILEKWTGKVRVAVRNTDGTGRLLKEPAAELAVNFKGER